MSRLGTGLLCALVALALNPVTATELLRKRYDAQAPAWMQNVASIEVPGIKFEHGRARHYTEYCSGTLLRDDSSSETRYVISAWHCVEYYQDLSRSIKIRFPHFQSSPSVYSARLIDSGGGITNDWALLELSNGPNKAQLPGMPLIMTDPAKPATAMGFALALDNGRQQLAFDDSCSAQSAQHWLNCTTSKGASGGPIVQTLGSSTGIVGVISQGDSRALTISYPTIELPQRLKSTFWLDLF